MRNIFYLFLFCTNIIVGQSLFKTIQLVDEFGDKIGEVKGSYAYGTFSNSATNNSKLKVSLQLKEFPNFNDYKVYQNQLIKQLSEEGFSQDIINYWAYRGKKSLQFDMKAIKGDITFKLFEYGEHLAQGFGGKIGGIAGQISVKMKDGRKLRAAISNLFVSETGTIKIRGYKESSKESKIMKGALKWGLIDWKETEIYNAILTSKEPIDVVISVDFSTYKFKITP